jgi:hypothetical protein
MTISPPTPIDVVATFMAQRPRHLRSRARVRLLIAVFIGAFPGAAAGQSPHGRPAGSRPTRATPQRRPFADEAIYRPMQSLHVELHLALDFDEAHSRTRCRFGDRLGSALSGHYSL